MEGSGKAPRIVFAGTGGDSGKTLVTLAVARAARLSGLTTVAFKKGPDYIDAAWLQWAAASTTRNLDTWLMGDDAVRDSFARHAVGEGLNLVEGNRGLFDGMDAAGTHSTASLARLIDAPVVLVLPVTKVTASTAATVLGFTTMDPAVRLGGVVLNRVSGARHEAVIREAIENRTGVPVMGAVPRLKGGGQLPERHLGLVPLHERSNLERVEMVLEEVAGHLDMAAILDLARAVEPPVSPTVPDGPAPPKGPAVRIGIFRDPAFSFYYPENLEALEALGAELVFLSPLSDPGLPDLDALYLGGGFPETHARELAGNRSMMASLKSATDAGLPVYAECGGLMVLSRSITWRGETFPMSGVLPVDTEVFQRPRGHGYAVVATDGDNPFYTPGTRLRGHEFHYSSIKAADPDLRLALRVERGHGCGDGRCGIVHNNVFATWVHVHALGENAWAEAVVGAARRHGDVGR
ncbi:MAG: cobyrinate a,c-diamide synthase [Deltaproteobacteria bacterium]|nr:cobyrinate a,c-diamide synthase [Deltaproteobacteria bacterium]